MTKYVSGQKVNSGGIYNEVASNGRVINTIEVKSGDTFPPTQSSKNHFEKRS